MVFIPLGDENVGRRHAPVVTWVLIGANVLVWLLQLAQGGEEGMQAFVMKWGAVPREFAQGQDLPPEIPVPFWSTLLTSMFLHGGWLHLLGNMLFLWIFGDNVEDAMGRARFLVFYLLCGVAAAAAQILVSANSAVPMVGASGAISGVLGAYLVLHPRGRVRVLVFRMITVMPAWVVLGSWILFQFVNHFAAVARTKETDEGGGVAYMAHIGGFVAGLLLVWIFRRRREAVVAS